MTLPPAPMPPQQEFDNGAFDGIAMGPPLNGNHGWDNDDLLNDLATFDLKPAKNKKNEKDKLPIDTTYEGWLLERIAPRPGEEKSWSRVGRKELDITDQKQLIKLARDHRQKTGTSAQTELKQLSPKQQGVIERLLSDKKLKEKNKNAEWVLHDIQKIKDERRKWGAPREIKKLQVILKRFDKNGKYRESDIIDLDVDPTKKKGKGKEGGERKIKKNRSLEDINFLDDPIPLGFDLGGPPPPKNHQQQHQFVPPPPQHPPLGALPPDHFAPQQFAPPPLQSPPFSAGPRQSQTEIHPFTPHSNVAFDMNDTDWPHPHQDHHHDNKTRARSQSKGRKPLARRASTGNRRLSRHEDRFEDMAFDVGNSNWRDDSSDSFLDEGSIFSRPPSEDRRSFTPPSSPRSYFSDGRAIHSLERRKSTSSRNHKYPSRRSNRDVDIEPENSYRSDRRPSYYSESRRSSTRPSIHRSVTYDDYPHPREPRYLPPADPPRLQRRLTEFGDGYDYRDRDRDRDDYRRRSEIPEYRRRPSMYEEVLFEAFEEGRRFGVQNSDREGRRGRYHF